MCGQGCFAEPDLGSGVGVLLPVPGFVPVLGFVFVGVVVVDEDDGAVVVVLVDVLGAAAAPTIPAAAPPAASAPVTIAALSMLALVMCQTS